MFKRKIKVTFYMKSGNKVKLRFEKFEVSKLSGSKGNRELDYTNCNKLFTLDIDELEMVVIN